MRRTLVLTALLLVGCSTKPKPIAVPGDATASGLTADPWPTVAATLRKQPDIGGARQAISQVTTDLANNPKAEPVPALSADAAKALAEQLRLTPNEAKEISSGTFTNLDSSYLAECLILRDAVRSLDLGSHSAERKAAFGFDWVCRQVYLRLAYTPTQSGLVLTQPLPPQYVLLRGYGSGLERAYVFLAVLQQLGFDGCLIGPPNREQGVSVTVQNGQPTKGPFWAVGARLPDGQIALFDPWRGQAFPGLNGGIGTLAQVLANPDQLKFWRDDKDRPWDVSADDVKAATVYAAFPFPAVTPRMKLLEQKIAADVGVKVSLDVAETVKRFGPAAKVWGPAVNQDPFCYTRALATFLPIEDGGSDATSVKEQRLFDKVTKFQVVPLELYSPPAELTASEIQVRLKGYFFGRYQEWILSLNPREKIDRGQFNELIRGLIDREQRLNVARDRGRATAKALPENAISAWAKQANALFQRVSEARLPQNQAMLPEAEAAIDHFWTHGGPELQYLEDSLIVPPCLADVSYFLAVCKHEQAERASIRLHRTPPGEKARAEADKAAKEAWAVAKDTWDRYFAGSEAYLKAYPERTPHLRKLAERATKLAANPTAEW